MTDKRALHPSDIMDIESYGRIRAQRRAEMVERRRHRRLAVGPNATLHFENFDTMLYQVHEMVWTERGGMEQILDELAAYNPLVPKGDDLVATLMLEVEDATERALFLAGLGGIEETVSLWVGDGVVHASWEQDVDRTTPEGKTSSVHFLHFHLSPQQTAAFKDAAVAAELRIDHPGYTHRAEIPATLRAELVGDLA